MSDISKDAPRDAMRRRWTVRTTPRESRAGASSMRAHASSDIDGLQPFLSTIRFNDDLAQSRAEVMRALQARGFDRLPLPGRGHTLDRWSALADVAACDLALVKLYEGHTDALAILAELGAHHQAKEGVWGVWAAEPPHRRVNATSNSDGSLRLEGVKPWCSGAAHCSHALVTAWRSGDPVLVAVDMSQPTIQIDGSRWQAVGMCATGTSDVTFEGSHAVQIGEAGAYLSRPGFWQGGAGIAACWFGCASAIAMALRDGVARRKEPHALAHLGALDATLSATAALLRETARSIDQSPRADARLPAMRARIAVERVAGEVMQHAGRALGAMPFCGDRWFARAMADLPVFLRQSHAERDEAALAESLLEAGATPWKLDQSASKVGKP